MGGGGWLVGWMGMGGDGWRWEKVDGWMEMDGWVGRDGQIEMYIWMEMGGWRCLNEWS